MIQYLLFTIGTTPLHAQTLIFVLFPMAQYCALQGGKETSCFCFFSNSISLQDHKDSLFTIQDSPFH